jgi:hypothetical protein
MKMENAAAPARAAVVARCMVAPIQLRNFDWRAAARCARGLLAIPGDGGEEFRARSPVAFVGELQYRVK